MPTQREAVANYRQRQRQQGLVRLEVQASEPDADLLRRLASTLRGNPGRASHLRRRLCEMIDDDKPDLKKILASAPLDGIDLTRHDDFGRTVLV